MLVQTKWAFDYLNIDAGAIYPYVKGDPTLLLEVIEEACHADNPEVAGPRHLCDW